VEKRLITALLHERMQTREFVPPQVSTGPRGEGEWVAKLGWRVKRVVELQPWALGGHNQPRNPTWRHIRDDANRLNTTGLNACLDVSKTTVIDP
jgi:hypothetical protein